MIATFVLLHGDVWTMDDARPRAEAVAIADGRIVAIGSDAEVTRWIGDDTAVLDATGRVVLPGFVDAHMHPIEGGVELGQCALFDAADRAALLAQIRGCAAAGSGWLEGTGWALPLFGPTGPTREELDAIVADRPALLWSADGHSAWVNSAALRLAHVTARTPDPAGGRIERAPDGSPAGTLREAAVDLVAERLPWPSARVLDDGRDRAVALANQEGITTALEANAGPRLLRAYHRGSRRGMTLRVTVALETDPTAGPEQIPALLAARARWRDRLIRIDFAKVFVDGVLEARTAVTLDPYTDAPPAPLALPADALRDLVVELGLAGLGVHAHAIGDGAVRVTLDAMAAARAAGVLAPLAVAHLELVDPADRPRFAALDVFPVFQPLWASPDPYVVDLTWPGLAPHLHEALYPIGSVVRAGATLAFGSDWSVSSLRPLEGIEVALTRQDPDLGGRTLGPSEQIDLTTALRAYTLGAATAIGRADEVGSLTVGKAGDLVVLSDDPSQVPPEALSELEVDATVFGGAVVWRR